MKIAVLFATIFLGMSASAHAEYSYVCHPVDAPEERDIYDKPSIELAVDSDSIREGSDCVADINPDYQPVERKDMAQFKPETRACQTNDASTLSAILITKSMLSGSPSGRLTEEWINEDYVKVLYDCELR